MDFKQKLLHNILILPGWRAKRKIVVIESDDWGAIRMSSKEAYEKLLKQGIKPASEDEVRYLQNDGLASANDLAGLLKCCRRLKIMQIIRLFLQL